MAFMVTFLAVVALGVVVHFWQRHREEERWRKARAEARKEYQPPVVEVPVPDDADDQWIVDTLYELESRAKLMYDPKDWS